MPLEETEMIERNATIVRKGRGASMKKNLAGGERRMKKAQWIWVEGIQRKDGTEMRIFHHLLEICLLHLVMVRHEKLLLLKQPSWISTAETSKIESPLGMRETRNQNVVKGTEVLLRRL